MENSKEIDLNKQNIERFEKLIASSKSMVFELEHEMAEVEVEHADLIMEIDKKKEAASTWFKLLRDQFCEVFEKIDQESKFERKLWPHKGKGGGEISIMKGKIFEKVGVNISTVSGEFSDDYRGK